LKLSTHNFTLFTFKGAHVAQSVEHILGKDEVTGSIPVMGFEKKHVISNLVNKGRQPGLGNQVLFTIH
jgi:hypothetical protein